MTKEQALPGIPILAPGERITADIVNYIQYAKEKGCSLTGPQDMEIARLNVVKKQGLLFAWQIGINGRIGIEMIRRINYSVQF